MNDNAPTILNPKSVVLYTTHCPKCQVLEEKLRDAGIDYTEVTDTNVMLDKGFSVTPILEVEGFLMDFRTANKWINLQKENKEE